jgi:small neutral amino acid transporter SnatA (MarC family)
MNQPTTFTMKQAVIGLALLMLFAAFGGVMFNAFQVQPEPYTGKNGVSLTIPRAAVKVSQPTERETQQARYRTTCLNLKYMANRPDKFPEIVRYPVAIDACKQLGLWEKEQYQQ